MSPLIPLDTASRPRAIIVVCQKLVLVLLERPSRLTESQVKVLIDIGVAAGQLSAASMVLPFVAPGLDKTKLPVILLGTVFLVVFWVGSVLLARKVKS